MDPTNPFHNLMANFDPLAQQLFSKYARETLCRLEKVERQIQLNHGFPDFKGLFQPQPLLVNVAPEIDLPKPMGWLISSESRDKHSQPNLKFNKPSIDSDKKALSNITKIFSSFLFVADLEAQYDESDDRKESAKESIKETIDDLFYGSRRTWTSSQDSHENYDVTFEIPIGREGGETLVISANWN